jgi:preprotein translocase subunit Sec63
MSILIENIRNVDSQNLRWCDYLQILGVTSDECKSEDRSPEKARQVERRKLFN